MTMNSEAGSNPLLHLNLSVATTAAGGIDTLAMQESPFVSNLNLEIDPDNLSFLIAVGDVTGAAQPLAVSRISCIGQLAILWLDLNHWLVLPPAGSGLSERQALEMTLGQDIRFTEQGHQLHADLAPAAARYLLESNNTADIHCEADQRLKDSLQRLVQDGVSIQLLSDQRDYDILLRQACVERLTSWLQRH